MIFVDTNYILRFLLEDIEEQRSQAKKLFLLASRGELELVSSVVVIFEMQWVLKSFYGYPKKKIISMMEDALALKFINWEERYLLLEAVELYKDNRNLSLEDCYFACFARDRGCEEIASFDKKLVNFWKKK